MIEQPICDADIRSTHWIAMELSRGRPIPETIMGFFLAAKELAEMAQIPHATLVGMMQTSAG